MRIFEFVCYALCIWHLIYLVRRKINKPTAKFYSKYTKRTHHERNTSQPRPVRHDRDNMHRRIWVLKSDARVKKTL
jgi:hypothetical protein